MDGGSAGRCEYTWPEDFDPELRNRAVHQSCCYRETWRDYDRCIWHADVEEEVARPVGELREQRETPKNREINYTEFKRENRFGNPTTETTPSELLDGAVYVATEDDTKESGPRLGGVSLRGADLTDAVLFGADFTDAGLGYADLTDAILWRADLTNADLGGADLTNADLGGADLTDAKLGGADLTDAALFGADFTDAGLGYADLTDAILSGANLTGANLRNADLTNAVLWDVDLTNAALPNADLTNAELGRADLTDADLSNSDLATALLPEGESLRQADLTEANLEGQDLRDYDLRGARLSKANLTDADLSNADLSGANLERALLNRADLFDTRLSGAQLEGTVLGDVQVNAGTFENLNHAEDTSPGLLTRLKRTISGPTGQDAYRCVYDPKSRYDPPEREANDDPPEVRAGGVYRQFERLAADNALPEWQSRFFVLRQDMQTRKYRRDSSWLDYTFALVQRALFGYGESFSRVIGWSAAIVLLFSLFYLAGGWIHPVEPGGEIGPALTWTRLPDAPGVVWDSFYYSTLTFTALGFGDFRPVGTMGQLFTIAETATGAVLLALLVFVLGRRAAR